jgi:hypothetical protein
MSEEHSMNRTAKALARKVANKTATPAEVRGFMEAVGLLGWVGVRGLGVVNHASNERVASKALLAAFLLEEAGDEEAALDRIEEAEAEEMAADEAATAAPAAGGAAPESAYLYTTRTPTIVLTERTTVDAMISEEIIGVTEGPCQSGAALECDRAAPNMGLLRTLPESMLPGQERTIILQCLPCYEASAEAYVRKLHGA